MQNQTSHAAAPVTQPNAHPRTTVEQHPVNPNLPKQITWTTMEFQEYKKHPLWFLVFGIITALLVLFGIIAGSWTTAVLFGLCGVLGLAFSVRKPKQITVTLDGIGVKVNNLVYNYRVIKKFWIIYSPPDLKVLYLETSAYLNHIVKLELGNVEPLKVKEYLKHYIPEDLEADESFMDMLARKIKF